MKKLNRFLALLIIIIFVATSITWKHGKPSSIPPEKAGSETESLSAIYANIFENYLPKDKPQSEEIFGYTSSQSNDRIKFDIDQLSFDLQRTADNYQTKLKVFSNSKILFSKIYPAAIGSISKILFKDKNIVLLNFYSGGAHCCSAVVPFLIDNNKIVEGKSLELGNIDIFNGSNFFVKYDKLFAKTTDDRFAYFEMDYADSGAMFFPTFFELSLNPLEFVGRNSMFTDIYSQFYPKYQAYAKSQVTAQNCSQEEIKKYPVFASLVSRYIYGYLSGVNRSLLKNELLNDKQCFKEKNFEEVEADIYKTLNGTTTKDFGDELIQKFYKEFNASDSGH